ncbi:MAG: fibronectin type III domain-containing protein, partial [Chitinophagales bacterium]
MRKLFVFLIGVSLVMYACRHEPLIVHTVIHIIDTTDTSGGGGCGISSGLYASSITSSSATLIWSVVSGAASYNVQYKVVGNSIWTPTIALSNFLPLSGLTANTSYEFQVQTVCSNGSSAFSASATFMITVFVGIAVSNCPSPALPGVTVICATDATGGL